MAATWVQLPVPLALVQLFATQPQYGHGQKESSASPWAGSSGSASQIWPVRLMLTNPALVNRERGFLFSIVPSVC